MTLIGAGPGAGITWRLLADENLAGRPGIAVTVAPPERAARGAALARCGRAYAFTVNSPRGIRPGGRGQSTDIYPSLWGDM